MLEFKVPLTSKGQRLDIWLTQELAAYKCSRSRVQRLIRDGLVWVGELCVKSSFLLNGGERVQVGFSREEESLNLLLKPCPLRLDIVFEDEDLLVVNKSAGVSVHPGAGRREPTLLEGLLYYVGNRSLDLIWDPGHARYGLVHRLDKDTTGLLVYAKKAETQICLSQQFKEKKNKRVYLTLLDGYMKASELTLENYLHRDPAQRVRYRSTSKDVYEDLCQSNLIKNAREYRLARSTFRRIETFRERYSYCSVSLHTGRTHQIRVHSCDLGLPVVGDPLYNRPKDIPQLFSQEVRACISSLKRQILHAHILGFRHPRTGEELSFQSPPPEDFLRLLELLSPYKDCTYA
ncbi:MAG: RluA family pseudouridine synthase [Oligoflexales bacterium]|nr:RluA family pseudouridine synthase [Oligoflexales bacterium]